MCLGCGRSGTPIFVELFNHFELYTYYSEPPFAQVIAVAPGYSMAFKVSREGAGFEPVDGLSFSLEALVQALPRIRLFWIVRHSLDVVCSLRSGIAQTCGHHPCPTDWEHWFHRPLLSCCAHHWRWINSLGFGRVADIATVVRFEELIAEPLAFAVRVCERIELDTKQAMLALVAWAGVSRTPTTNVYRSADVEGILATRSCRTDWAVARKSNAGGS